MLEKRVFLASAALAVLALSSTAAQATTILGDSVQVQEYYPNLTTPDGGPTPAQTVTAGGVTFLDIGASSIDITVTPTTITLTGNYTPLSAAFNGFDIQDLNLSNTITNATLDASSGALPGGDLTFDGHDVFVNVEDVSLSANTPIIIDLTTGSVNGGVPEPATWAMMLAGVFGVGGMMRGRRSKRAIQAV